MRSGKIWLVLLLRLKKMNFILKKYGDMVASVFGFVGIELRQIASRSSQLR